MIADSLGNLSAKDFRRPETGEVALQQCASCSQVQSPADFACKYCRSEEWQKLWIQPRGTIYSLSQIHRPLGADEKPYWVALIDLDEGPRIAVQLGDETDTPEIGDRAEGMESPGSDLLRMRHIPSEVEKSTQEAS